MVQRSSTEESETDNEDEEEISCIPTGFSIPVRRKRIPVSKPTSTTAAPKRKDKQTSVGVFSEQDKHIHIPLAATTENVKNIIETEQKKELRGI